MVRLSSWFSILALSTRCSSLAEPEISSRSPATSDDRLQIHSSKLAEAFKSLSRSTKWSLTDSVPLRFNTFHPQGLAITPKRMFLSSVEIIEPTVPYAHPRKNGYDRTPGKGIGHVFVLDHKGNLEKDIKLAEGHDYHPGGIDFDGKYIWVPLAQYRPNSHAVVYRLDADTLKVERKFEANDHYGGFVHDKEAGTLVANNWGSRNFTEFSYEGDILRQWANVNWFIDYQDGQYVKGRKMIAGGIAELPQVPVAVNALGAAAIYELGGVSLVDLDTQELLYEVPVQVFSKAGHVVTRNPMKMGIKDGKLTIWVAPDDGSEVGGTRLLTYTSDVEV